MNTQKVNWWIDAAAFLGFMVSFFTDITGVEIHQWMGIIVGLFILIHFFRHLEWISTVVSKFFGKTSLTAKVNLILDALIGLGFFNILFTGLIISTWLNLTFIDYSFWKNLHVALSVITLFALLFKLILHRKWIISVADKYIFRRTNDASAVVVAGTMSKSTAQSSRREFLKLSAVLGAGAVVGVVNIHKLISDVLTEQTSQNVSSGKLITTAEGQSVIASPSSATFEITETPVPVVQKPSPTEITENSQTSSACSILCHKSCSYPGRCRRYVDTNGNGKCDRGECL